MNRNNYILECCVDSAESALEAAGGGADRLELCAALVIGGTSPSLALYEEIRKYSCIPIRVLLRPRFGDFLYTDHELAIIKREIGLFKEAGAEGVVIGCLTADGDLDMEQMKELMREADGMKVTLHRAFDLCRDPLLAYGQAAELGIDTILTSGQQGSCLEGMELLQRLCEKQRKEGGPDIMAGAGVTPDVIRKFLEQTDIASYHLSAKRVLDSGMRFRKEGVPMGLPAMSEYGVFRTDGRIVGQAKKILEEHRNHHEPFCGAPM